MSMSLERWRDIAQSAVNLSPHAGVHAGETLVQACEEISRLRSALREIVAADTASVEQFRDGERLTQFVPGECANIARRALEGGA